MSFIIRLLQQKHNPPRPSTESFAGLTVLVTGATSGLGLEAAKKLAALRVSRLLITARTEAKGQAAKREIEEFLAASSDATTTSSVSASAATEIIPLILDMSSFAAVKSFVDALSTRFHSIDSAILNAGVLMSKHSSSSDGWEDTLLLSSGLAPGTSTEDGKSRNSKNKPHLTFVSSGNVHHMNPEKMAEVISSETPLRDLSPKFFPPGLAGASAQYNRSKLILEYAARHLAASAALKNPNGQGPRVIVNTVCPGMCKSDLGRQLGDGAIVKIIAWFMYRFLGRTAEQGANSYTTALSVGDDGHGRMWKDDRVYEDGPMLSSQQATEFGEKVWAEVSQVMLEADESTKVFLA